jgi:hypothetical protein
LLACPIRRGGDRRRYLLTGDADADARENGRTAGRHATDLTEDATE